MYTVTELVCHLQCEVKNVAVVLGLLVVRRLAPSEAS